jgi:hypothetical protein
MALGTISYEQAQTSKTAALAVTNASAVILTEVLEKTPKTLGFVLKNTGAKPLAALSLEVQMVPGGTWVALEATWTVAGLVRWVSGSLATLAAAATGAVYMDLPPVCGVRFKANCGGTDSTTVTLEVSLN